MKRLANVRLPVLCTLSLALGILAEYAFSYYKIDTFWSIAVIPVTALFFVVFLLTGKLKFAIFALILGAVFILGFFNCFWRISVFEKCDIAENTEYYVTGIVSEKGVSRHGEYIILKNAMIDGINLSGKIRVNLGSAYGDFCDAGYRVGFTSVLAQNDLFPFGEFNYNAEQNVKYTCSVYGGLTSEYGFSLFGYLRSAIRNAVFENINEHTAPVLYAMLTGNTEYIEAETLTSFRYGGIAHIFAVSGLHIGIIYGLVRKFCKITHVNKYVSAFVAICLITVYSGICGFTLSSVRAVIMCAVAIITDLLYVKNDGFNSLANSAFIILCITPLSLFSIGFQLSVCAMGGIFMFSNKIRNALTKIKIPAKIGGNVGTAVGAQFGTMPVMLAGFGYLSGSGLLLNLVLLPILSLLYTIFFIGALISIIIPPCASFILPALALPMEAVISFLTEIGFEKSLVSGFGAGLFVPVYYLCILIISDKLNIKLLPRAIIFAVAVLGLSLYVILQTVAPVSNKVIISGGSAGGNVILKTPRGTVLIVTEYASYSRVAESQNKYYSSKPDGIIFLGGDDCANNYNPNFDCDNVYISSWNFPYQPYRTLEFNYCKSFSLCGIDFEFADGNSVTFDFNGVTIAVCADRNIPFENCDLLVSRYLNRIGDTYEKQCDTNTEIYFSVKGSNYNCYEYGDFVFKPSQGKLKLINKPRVPY